ncbi:MAG: PQQ-binding-like beta-propeller repeat protein [Actinomycetota bacterium]|nr:PQQ-binding-like beta-propeller repeat protein [Actinomycetota bacterium]
MTSLGRTGPGRVALGTAALALLAVGCGSSTGAKAPGSSAPAPSTVSTVAPTAPTGPAPTAAAGLSGALPWPAALHDSAHSGGSVAVGPTAGTMLWTRNLGAPITGGAVVGADGTIFESANNGILHALDPATGADRWTFDGGGSPGNNQDLSISPAILADGTIVWPAPNSMLDGVSPAGKLLWQQKLAGLILSPAVAAGDKVYVADSVGGVAAFHATAAGAQQLWTTTVGKASFGSPAVGPDGTIYATADRDLIALRDAGDHATVAWRFTAGSDIEVSPSVAPDGTVVLGTNDAYEYGITAKGTVAWRYPRHVFSYSTPAATADGLAYFGDNDGYVDVVQAATGKVVGRYNGTTAAISSNGIGVWTAPLVDAHHDVYFGTASGHIIGTSYEGAKLFDIATGAIVASYPAMTANGTLIIGSDNGSLYAFHS